MDLRVHENVVDVQLSVKDALGGIDNRARGEHGGEGDPLLDTLDGEGRSGTLSTTSGSLLLHGEAEEQVTGGDKEDVALGFQIYRNEPLTIVLTRIYCIPSKYLNILFILFNSLS